MDYCCVSAKSSSDTKRPSHPDFHARALSAGDPHPSTKNQNRGRPLPPQAQNSTLPSLAFSHPILILIPGYLFTSAPPRRARAGKARPPPSGTEMKRWTASLLSQRVQNSPPRFPFTCALGGRFRPGKRKGVEHSLSFHSPLSSVAFLQTPSGSPFPGCLFTCPREGARNQSPPPPAGQK